MPRLQDLVNDEPSVSDSLPVNVPQFNVDCMNAVASRERARRLDGAVIERFEPENPDIQAVAFRAGSQVSAQRVREVVRRYSSSLHGSSPGGAYGLSWLTLPWSRRDSQVSR